MNRFLIFLIGFFCLSEISFSDAQAHLGASELEIRNMHSDVNFQVGTSNSGQRYIYGNMGLGTFYYYFNSSTNLTDYVMNVPNSMVDLNTQVEVYNKKYVVTSKTSWTAYLEGGGLMYIKLLYSDEYKLYYFSYKDTE